MTTIKLRRGLSTAFSTNNPILAAGEPAFATDTGILKIGDGTTAYNSLPSIGASPDLTNYVTTNTAQTISATKTFSANQNIGSIQVNCNTPTIRPTGTMTFRRDASSSSSDSTGIVFSAANNTNGEVHLGVHGNTSYRGGIVLNQASNPYRYYPSIMFCYGGSNPDSPSSQITFDYNTHTLNMSAPTGGGLMLGAPGFWGGTNYTGLEVARDGSLLRYNGNKVLDASCVDGTTITYNSSTGKISSAGSAPSNMVTTDTQQTINATKYFNSSETNGGTRFYHNDKGTDALNFVGMYNSGRAHFGTSIATGLYDSSTFPALELAPRSNYNNIYIEARDPSSNYRTSFLNVTAPYIHIGPAATAYDASYTGLRVRANGSLLQYNNKDVVTSSDVNNIVKLTQAAYDALATKDANTFYVIIPASS